MALKLKSLISYDTIFNVFWTYKDITLKIWNFKK